MESLAPPLAVLLHVRYGLSAGRSLRRLIKDVVMKSQLSNFELKLRRWWLAREAGSALNDDYWEDQSLYRQALVQLLEQGLEGRSISEALKDLEEEIRRAMEEELNEFVAALPLKTLFPLLLLIFPSLMLLIFGPLVLKLMESMQ
jgi:tight adherence protein C